MKIEDFKKTKEELEVQKKQNDEQVYVSDERTRIAKVNQFEYKAGATLTFSMFGYLLLVVIPTILTRYLGTTAFTSIFPGFSYPIALLGGSLGIGTIARKIMYKKSKIKERLETFSTAKTQAEKLEEEIQYQIELEKAKNRNKAIAQTLEVLNFNESILKGMSDRYDINDKNTSQTEAEAKQKIEELSTLVKEKYDELDLATTKKVLSDRFWKIRAKSTKGWNTIMTSVFSGMGTMLLSVSPILLIRDAITYNSLFASLATIFAPFIVGIVGSAGYMVKRNKDYKKVFNSLNTKLGDNALDDKINESCTEVQELTALIENITKDISVAEIQLKEQQRALETIQVKNAEQKQEKDSKDLEQTTSPYTIEEMKLYQQESSILVPTELIYGQGEVSDETQYDITQKSGPTPVKRRKSTNLNDKK